MNSVKLLIVLCVLCSVIGFVGCHQHTASPVSSLSESVASLEPQTSKKVGSVVFKIVLPESDYESALNNIRASTAIATPTVTFSLKIINFGNAAMPVSVVVKTVLVEDGTASVIFENIPASTCIGDVIINGGNISGFSRFHGAVDLKASAGNVLEVSPLESRTWQDFTAHVIKEIIACDVLFGKAVQNLAAHVRTAISGLNAFSGTAYEDAVKLFANYAELQIVINDGKRTVSYHGNAHTSGSVPVDSNAYTFAANATLLAPTEGFARENYNFTGWNTQADGAGTTYQPGDALTIGIESVTLYAKWTPKTYSITYDPNGATGGNVPVDNNTYINGAIFIVKGNTGGLVRSGDVFTGWNTKADGSGTNYSSGASLEMGLSNITFYAVWTTWGSDYTSTNIGVLKYVPPGTFQRDDIATNTSTVSAFRMSRYEITRAQFNSIMGADPSATGFSSGVNDPVQMVNWYHAIAFCNKLSINEDLTPAYSVLGVDFSTLKFSDIPTSGNSDWNNATCNWSANGYRLPTEMEWMWAAMGAQDARTKNYAGDGLGGSVGDYAWYSANSGNNTKPVGTKTANELGLYDMNGNVYELCWDWMGSYPSGSQTNYRGHISGFSTRVIRGGCFSLNAEHLPVAFRNQSLPSGQNEICGFRVARP